VNPEISFPDHGSVKEDFREQMQKLVKLMNSSRGEVLASVIGCGQSNDQLISAFRENWLTPRREDAKLILQRGVERGELKKGIDAEVAIDALYSPLFYRLLLKHQPLTNEFIDNLIDLVLGGLSINKY
ncbi:MAG: TetR-like C-terminal domain-containing protein, partial [Cyanobacteria bacterium P01_A01_bin.45]